MVSVGSDIGISIDGVDYSSDINSITESGGDRVFVTKKMLGNNYKKIETGRNDYELVLNFKMESTTLNSLYEITTPINIVITGTDFTVTYYNMLPSNLTLSAEVEDIATGELTYSAPAYDKVNTRYNRVIS